MGDLSLGEHDQMRADADAAFDRPAAAMEPYASHYRDWNETWIRSGRAPLGEIRGAHRFHDPCLVPEAQHPAFAEASERAQNRMLAHRIHRWLVHFTPFIEEDLVAPVAEIVRRGLLPPLRAAPIVADARYLQLDELAHSVFSLALAEDIERAVSIDDGGEPLSVEQELRAMMSELHGIDRPIGALGATVATETLITGELGAASRSPSIFPAIVQVMRSHARDEARHRLLFTDWFCRAWPTMSAARRRVLAMCAGRTIVAYLRVDVRWLAAALARCGIGRDPIAVAHEVAHDPQRVDEMRRGAHSTLTLLRGAGAFDDPEVEALFHELSLLD